MMQGARLRCGGFIRAVRLNHTMSDASGLVQFMTTVCEMGAAAPTVLPVWQRHLLNAQNPPSRKEESEKEEWTLTYKPFALGLVTMEMAFLLSSIWAASFGETPQAHWTWVPMLFIQGMVTLSLSLCLFALLSGIMTNEQRSRLVYFSLVLVMIGIILSIISSVVYNWASHNKGH